MIGEEVVVVVVVGGRGGGTNHTVSLVTTTDTASFGVTPLSLVEGPVRGASSKSPG